MLFVNSKTVKYQELLVAVVLSKTFFKNINLYVGDKVKTTDIYTRGRRLGIEVVQAEYLSDFLMDNYSKLKNKDMSAKSFFQMTKLNKNSKVLSWSYNTTADDKYVMEQFKESVANKLAKLQNGNYSNIKSQVDLAVLSYLRIKDNSDAENFLSVYNQESAKVDKGFDNVFLIFSSGIYLIKNGKIEDHIEFVGEDFLNYQRVAKSMILNNKKTEE